MSQIGDLKPAGDLDGPYHVLTTDSQYIVDQCDDLGLLSDDVTGLIELTTPNGWETLEVWTTGYSRPFAHSAIYERVA